MFVFDSFLYFRCEDHARAGTGVTRGHGFAPQTMLRRRGFNMIKITPEEVMQYSANIQSLGNGKVISSTTNTKVNQIMRDLGLEVIEVDISEIVKGGGGIHCMTFPLVREAE